MLLTVPRHSRLCGVHLAWSDEEPVPEPPNVVRLLSEESSEQQHKEHCVHEWCTRSSTNPEPTSTNPEPSAGTRADPTARWTTATAWKPQRPLSWVPRLVPRLCIRHG
jgi:hypothetical protein